MNNLQKIASGISGFHPSLEGFDQGAKDDGYYNQPTAYDKLLYIVEYSFHCDEDSVKGIDLNKAKKVFWFLETDFKGSSNDLFYAFKDLK